jgi:class 3 adenylate cyclase
VTFSAWLWRRWSRHYIDAIVIVVWVSIAFGLALPSAVVVALYLDFNRAQTIVLTLVAMVMVGPGLWLAVWLSPRQLDPLRPWLRGDRSDPAGMWNAAVAIPSVLAVRAGVVELFGLEVSLLSAAALLGDPGPSGLIALAVGTLAVVSLGAVVFASALYLLIRPVLDSGVDSMPIDRHPDRRGWSLSVRFCAAVAAVSTVTGLIVPAAILGTSATPRDYSIAVGSSVVLAAYLVVLFNAGLVRPTTTAIADLVQATQRVRRGDLLTPVPVTTAEELGELAVSFNVLQQGLREREALHAAFGSYVDPALAQRLLATGSSVFDGEELDLTVMFVDVRSFTSYSEGVAPQEAVQLLNRLFDVIVPVIEQRGGHTNHYLGDGLLAVFGAPTPIDLHADAALAAAMEIQRQVRADLRGELRIGIGINSGAVIAGTVGGGGRHEFTVIGDTVNIAARVEQLTKETGDAILITEATRLALTTPRPRTVRRGEFAVRGKATKLTLHAVNPFPRSTR